MAEPLTLQFAADVSRAQNAMATLAGSVVSNMTSMAAAMSGGAASTNSLGQTLGGLAQNASRAAAAVSQDVRSIGAATLGAAARDGATLESIVRSFTAAAAASNTASATVSTGMGVTGSTISTVVAQVPSLTTLLRAFLAFEAAKLVFEAVSSSIDEARQHVENFTKIARDADKVGVGSNVYQRLTLDAKSLGLETQQVVAALERAKQASSLRIGEGEHGRTTSVIADRVEQNVRAGNLSRADQAQLNGAQNQEQRIRVVLDLIDKLRAAGRDVAAFDLAEKFFGRDFETKLRQGVELTRRLRDQMDSTSATAGGQRVISQEEITRAEELERKLKDISNVFSTALAPIQRDFSNSALDVYNNFLDFEAALARTVLTASNLYVEISRVADKIAAMIPSAGRLSTSLGAVEIGKYLGVDQVGPKAKEVLGNMARSVGLGDTLGLSRTGETQAQADDRNAISAAQQVLANRMRQPGAVAQALEDTKKIDFRTPVKRADTSNVLPSLARSAPKSSSGGSENLDAVETLINQIEKARDTAKAELENVEKTNVEREKAVALAKAEAVAREDVKKGKRDSAELTTDERTRVLAAAEAWQTYKDRVMDAQQAIRQAAEAARYFGDMAANSLADAILEGRSFSDVLGNIQKQIARAALQAAFTGQGPLASLLGTAPTASSGDTVGGIAGLLKGLLPGAGATGAGSAVTGALQGPTMSGATLDTVAGGGGLFDFFGSLFRANGGPVKAGVPYTVGEMGREMFIPSQNGRIVPIERGFGGEAGITNNIGGDTISITSAQGVTPQQMLAALAQRDAQFRRNINGIVADGRRRYRPA